MLSNASSRGDSSSRKLSKGEVTRLSILRAAEASFAGLGYDAARLETIADDVGIKRAAIFYYFPSKQRLFEELSQEIHHSLVSLTQTRLDGVIDPWEKLMLLVETWLDFMVGRPTAARLILRNCATPSVGDEPPEAYSGNALQLLRTTIAEGIAAGRFADVNSMYLVNLLSGSILHYVCNPEQLGSERPYRPDDPNEVMIFKSVLRKTARAVLNVQ
ncbi:TetR/AcrR family transcriptional regulator [Sphingobium sp. EM0848]|uniref:TetR/AcrR family transcriptional regulator n=1 Tax=Sphingobium sp. EM0848 TaxID=2743473 RepID=UPI00159C521C|nr:TetR/AcrR family transcriptional regulator [Sphingobium sp. EM0848]